MIHVQTNVVGINCKLPLTGLKRNIQLDGEISYIHTVEFKQYTIHVNDNGLVPAQTRNK